MKTSNRQQYTMQLIAIRRFDVAQEVDEILADSVLLYSSIFSAVAATKCCNSVINLFWPAVIMAELSEHVRRHRCTPYKYRGRLNEAIEITNQPVARSRNVTLFQHTRFNVKHITPMTESW